MSDDYSILRQELADHVAHCEKHFTLSEQRYNEWIICTQQNTEAVTQMVLETKEVIQLYKDLRGVIRIGVVAQKFGMWVIKWPLIGAGIFTIYKWAINAG